MLTKAEATFLVEEYLRKMESQSCPLLPKEAATMEKAFGWVYFFNSKKYLETGDLLSRLAGNGPIVVNKFTGTIVQLGTNKSVETLVEEYERGLK